MSDEKKVIKIELPLWMHESIEIHAKRIDIEKQDLIKILLSNALDKWDN